MCKTITLIILLIASEIILAFAFAAISQIYYKEVKGIDWKSIFKGFFERMFLAICLINNLPHALTLFSALKLATRLKHDETKKVEQASVGTEEKQMTLTDADNKYNDYYLLGNLTSVLVAISYWYAYSNFPELWLFKKICGQ
ncbi:hypothetical protein [Chitinophaga agri]|uniref:Uncharacterized protein n=1 Tax=Chitinophaga agri TaxID=2703787 RepID=A0A6B9ZML0_9BACT|nr:hypothetical protein [Chitinophaga agri]QHS63187.1 hypothetical protein GWR21_27440 [Chitinophaga agri]